MQMAHTPRMGENPKVQTGQKMSPQEKIQISPSAKIKVVRTHTVLTWQCGEVHHQGRCRKDEVKETEECQLSKQTWLPRIGKPRTRVS